MELVSWGHMHVRRLSCMAVFVLSCVCLLPFELQPAAELLGVSRPQPNLGGSDSLHEAMGLKKCCSAMQELYSGQIHVAGHACSCNMLDSVSNLFIHACNCQPGFN